MNYENFSVHDFIKDEFFYNWVMNPDSDKDHFWSAWLEAHPTKIKTINRARFLIERLGYKNEYKMNPSVYTGIFENMIRYKSLKDATLKQKMVLQRKIMWMSSAAMIFFALAAIFYITIWKDSDPQLAIETEYIEKQVPSGSKLSMILPDGTIIKLNSLSSIQYPKTFDGKRREVYLQGEAFFEVAKDPSKPFVIHSTDLITKVLGTSFNISSNDNNEIRVAVISGLVEVTTKDGQSSLIHPDNMAIYSPQHKALEVGPFDIKNEIGWRDGILYFEKTPLKKVFSVLESWYGVKISISDDISLMEPYSGEYSNENLDNVLNGIGFTSGFKFSIDGKQVKIFK